MPTSTAPTRPAGVAPYPLNVISGRRINTGIAFLGDDVRMRPNLTITSQVEVDRVLIDGDRAVAVVDTAGTHYRDSQVILSAGAFGSAAILMRSGIGRAAHLPRHTCARGPASRRGPCRNIPSTATSTP